MRIAAISTVRDEVDIVEPFLRHTAALVDFHLVLDNGSTDGTDAVMAALVDEGLDLVVDSDPRPGFYQAERMTRLMRRAASEFDADWVLPLDADEFVVTRSRRSLHGTLAQHDTAVLLKWRTYVPDPSDDHAERNVVKRIRHRLAVEATDIAKVAVPASLARSEALLQGSHDLEGESVRAAAVLTDAHLAHFPARSVEQFTAKVAIGTFQHLARGHRGDWGYHYIEPFETLVRDPDEFAQTFYEAARRFGLRPGERFEGVPIEDPVDYRGGRLRHTPAMAGSALSAIVGYTADLASRYGELSGSELAWRTESAAPPE